MTLEDIHQWREKLYHGNSKIEQNRLICRFLAVGEPPRKRSGKKFCQISISYMVSWKILIFLATKNKGFCF